ILSTAAATTDYEMPIAAPIKPKLDVSACQRVLVAAFIAGGTEDVDGNLGTTRLLRSQLRTKSELRVIDADVLPLMEVANEDPGKTEAKAEPAAAKSEPGAEGEGKDVKAEAKEAKDAKGAKPDAKTEGKEAGGKEAGGKEAGRDT